MAELLHPDHVKPLKKAAAAAQDASMQRRAQLLLLYDKGRETASIAEAVGLSPSQVRYWRRQYLELGLGVIPGPAGPAEKPPGTEQDTPETAGERRKKKKPKREKACAKQKEKKGKKAKKLKKEKRKKKGKGKKGKKKDRKGTNKKRSKTKKR
jgi:transposase-like protein